MRIIGHRGGARLNQTDNTLNAFIAGFQAGAEVIETDLQITKDLVVILHHDTFFMNQNQRIDFDSLSFSELRALKPEVPSLDELWQFFPDKKFIFELKPLSDYVLIIEVLWQKHLDKIINQEFISFSARALQMARTKFPDVYCSYLGTCWRDDGRFQPFSLKKHLTVCLANNFQELVGHRLTFSTRHIKLAQANGLKVGLGPINNLSALKRCQKLGIDSVFTDSVKTILS